MTPIPGHPLVRFALAVLCLSVLTSSSCGGMPIRDGAVLSFESGVEQLVVTGKPQFIGGTPAIVPDGAFGSALRLDDGQCVHFQNLDFGRDQGTIGFWVRPDWHYYESERGKLTSHTLLSGRRSNGSYMVLSDGWWEARDGGARTFFVADNKALAHVSDKHVYKADRWTHFTLVWSTSGDGRIALYVDGVRRATKNGYSAAAALTDLYLGCDHGTTIRGDRWANSDFDEVLLSDRAYSDAEVAALTKSNAALPSTDPARWVRSKLNSAPANRGAVDRNVENRVIFDEGPAEWQTREKTDQLIARLKRAGINIYVPCVWHGDGTRYPSSVAPPARYIGKGDPLRYLIEVAHANDIEVHPWFTIALRTRNFLPQYYNDSTPPMAFDMFDAGFRDFIVDVVLEVVANYDVDGINLDYIRTKGGPRGPKTAAQYRKRFGRSLDADKQDYLDNGGLEEHLQTFVDEAVGDVVTRVSRGVRMARPQAVISIDGHPKPSVIRPSRQGRRELRWLQQDLIDVVFAMSYDAMPDIDALELFMQEVPRNKKIIMLVGAHEKQVEGGPPRSPGVVTDLVELARTTSSDGVAIYPLSRLSERHISALASGPFKQPARADLSATRPAAVGSTTNRDDGRKPAAHR